LRVSALVLAVLGVAVAASPNDGEPSLRTVLTRGGAYVAGFLSQLSGIVAEESYVQDVRPPNGLMARLTPEGPGHRVLKSDFLLVRCECRERYVAFRDVFEVDDQPIRGREERLAKLFSGTPGASDGRVQAIMEESARFNIGEVRRTVNVPVLALLFLRPEYQSRIKFKRVSRRPSDNVPDEAKAADHVAATFGISTEVWAIDFRETGRGTMVRTPEGRDLPARGRFWIEPETGRVLLTELTIVAPRLEATIDVKYQPVERVQFLVPVEMRERYEGQSVLIEAVADYSAFRELRAGEALPSAK